jgi:predicted nucleic acid-binding protein
MATVVVDTNVISFLEKGDTRGALYERHLVGNTLVLSFMSLAELDRWAIARNWGDERKARMAQHLGSTYLIHPFDRALCLEWARVSEMAKKNGKSIATADAWIASTATIHSIALVTHNPKDFDGVPGLKVITEA